MSINLGLVATREIAGVGSRMEQLKKNILYCCDSLGDFCDIIRPRGACYIPNKINHHADRWNCDILKKQKIDLVTSFEINKILKNVQNFEL